MLKKREESERERERESARKPGERKRALSGHVQDVLCSCVATDRRPFCVLSRLRPCTAESRLPQRGERHGTEPGRPQFLQAAETSIGELRTDFGSASKLRWALGGRLLEYAVLPGESGCAFLSFRPLGVHGSGEPTG